MNISFSWLKQHVKLPDSITPEEVAEKLKLATVEVEGIVNQGATLANVVVGKVLKAEKHPNADKLKVCSVDVGAENFLPIQIVCGGSNVVEGMLTAVAKNGAKVKWHGEGELVELKPTTIRGVESNGMICGADEIGLAEMFPKKDEKEIVDLTSVTVGANDRSPLQPGTPLAEALGLNEAVLEIDNKSLSNRPDLWGHYGMAREVAVLTNREVEKYETKEVGKPSFAKAAAGKQEIKIKIEVEDTKLCPRYMAVAMSGIKVGESPAWLKERLTAVGLRPINNIVDITNYVMLDVGQPMHAFDAKKLAINKEQLTKAAIRVKRASEGDKFTTLDGKEHTLTSETLVIANSEKTVALAGVMGGLDSGITSDTTTIVFESANFDASSVRKTSTKLGIRTDSSSRFEKSLDPNLCKTALEKAVALVLEVCPGAAVASKVVDEKHFRLQTGPLEIPVDFFAHKIGVEIPVKTIITTLERLGFEVKEKKQSLFVKIPTWRATKDIVIAEDVVEEVLRIFGYDNVPSALPVFTITPPEKNALRELEYKVGDMLVKELGYAESYNYSFVSAAQIAAMGESTERYIELDNPLSKEKPFARRCLLLNLLENVKNNQADFDPVQLFEIGKVFRPENPGLRAEANGDELLPQQDTYFTSVYSAKKDSAPFWQAKRVVETITQRLNLPLRYVTWDGTGVGRHPSRASDIKLGDAVVGSVYELHPSVASNFGVDNRVSVVKLNLTAIAPLLTQFSSNVYKPLSSYPAVTRDVAFLVKKINTHQSIVTVIKSADPLITNVELFDVFEGKNIAEGYKSMAYHVTYAANKTLTTEEVDKAEARVKNVLKEKFGAEVRK